ncbi:MAG TPA: bifunctional DNA primase/polymerase [Tepidisphaeraceae bacterium]|jgi:hypothetical protein|nr:bifunctional DNA primase/polymerase [Tepidisphaeraceae bacterium]
MRSLLEHALAYTARGWLVFPLHNPVGEAGELRCSCGRPEGKKEGECSSPAKHPRTKNGLSDATTDAAQITAWWTRWPDANIGLRTGLSFIVIDVDPRHGGDASLDELETSHGLLPHTPESQTGGLGRHLLFNYIPGFRNSNNAIAPGIDARGEGGYIVAPPSRHMSGNHYEWESSSHPDDVPLADLPDWLCPGSLKIGQLAAGNLAFTAGPVKADGSPVAIGGRNTAAASLAGQFITAGDSLHEVMRKLNGWNENNPAPLSAAELARTAASVARTHLTKNPGAVVYVSEPEIEPSATLPNRSPFPADLLNPPGFVGELCRWINATAYKPQPVFALANSLAFFGTMLGRKVATAQDLRTNIYCLGVGASGSGKDHSRKCIKKICAEAGIVDAILGGEDIASDSALFSTVHAQPTVLFQLDEIGHMIRATMSKYAQNYQRAIPVLLTKMFSSANTVLLGKDFADRKNNERKKVDQPNVCLYGTTVPGRLYDGLSPDEIADGFLGRMIIFESDDPDPKEHDDVVSGAVPSEILAMVKAWHVRRLPAPPDTGNIDAVIRTHPILVPFEPDAEAEFRRFVVRCRDQKAAHRSSSLDALWSRAVEHARKVALILACGIEYTSPRVTADVAAYAVALVEHLVTQLVISVQDNVSSSEFGREINRVLKAIRTGGADGVTTTQLSRLTQGMQPRVRTEALNELVINARIIKTQKKAARGAPATVYVAA